MPVVEASSPRQSSSLRLYAVRDLLGNEGTAGTIKYSVTVTNTGNIDLDLQVTVTVVFADSTIRQGDRSFNLAAGASVFQEIIVGVLESDPVGDFQVSAALHDPVTGFTYDIVAPFKIGEVTGEPTATLSGSFQLTIA